MLYNLENKQASVVIATRAAEIHSFKKKSDGVEVMWQGDPHYWAGRNPILFPQVGNTYNKKQIFKGHEYALGNHGFARHSEFTLVDKGNDTLTLVLKADERTKALYPYDFALYVHYHLTGSTLNLSYRIENHDTADLPFGFGLHPAFNCPLVDDRFEDYYLAFASEEEGESAEYQLFEAKKIHLNRELFSRFPTLIFKQPVSPFVTLTNGVKAVRVKAAAYPWLAFWSPGNAPFICIEPWLSHGDFAENDLPFAKREGIINLTNAKHFITEYSIEIL